MPGTLYVVSTPIGNLRDITFRAVELLKEVALIACEDTRVTARLLARYGIKTPTVSYHEHNEKRRAVELAGRLQAGQDIALVSDAGTPGVSDPGYRLVAAARERNIPIRAAPGPSAALAALSVSGLPSSGFCFLGFLPRRPSARRHAIEALAREPRTTILFESSRRAPALLAELARSLGARPAFAARELTKIHEEHRAGTLPELARWAVESRLKGELTLVIAAAERVPRPPELASAEPPSMRSGAQARPQWAPAVSRSLQARFRKLTASGLTRRQAVKILAREIGLPTRDLYRQLLIRRAEKT